MITPRPLRHWALTISRPSANVTLVLLRVADLAAALPENFFSILLVFVSLLLNLRMRFLCGEVAGPAFT